MVCGFKWYENHLPIRTDSLESVTPANKKAKNVKDRLL